MALSAGQKQRLNYHYMADAMRRLEWDLHQKVLREGRLPEEWHAIAKQRDEPKKVRVNLTVEEDVAKFFRSMGRNYQARMNEVLRAFMHARLSGMISGGETMDYFARRHDEELDGQKPAWGEYQKRYDWMEDGDRLMSEQGGGIPIGEERKAVQNDGLAWFEMRNAREKR